MLKFSLQHEYTKTILLILLVQCECNMLRNQKCMCNIMNNQQMFSQFAISNALGSSQVSKANNIQQFFIIHYFYSKYYEIEFIVKSIYRM